MSDGDLTLHVTDQHGHRYSLPALEGWRVMEIVRDHELPIRAECGGAAACATCHIYLAQEWVDKVPPPHPDEQYMLDGVQGYEPGRSRLSCQILLDETMDGLEITLAPGSEP